MKQSIILFVLLFFIDSASADCGIGNMSFLPSSKEISLNSKFIIEGYGYAQKTINSFKDRTIYLQSEDGDSVELILQEFLIGQKELTQAFFCPIRELNPNTTYYLMYSEETKTETNQMSTWNREIKKRERIHWNTTSKKSETRLNSNLTLKFEKTNVEFYGCGPAANAIFNIENKPEYEVWYKAEVTELDTNKASSYYIREWNDKLNIGHGMCSGAFTFKPKGKYKVRFTPLNIDGEKLKTTNWITFQSPFANRKSPFGF